LPPIREPPSAGDGRVGPLLGMFAVDHASQVRAHIPRMGISPELDTSDAPAFAVQVDGQIPANKMPMMLGAPGAQPPSVYVGVMCVVAGSDPTWYTGVDTTGWHA
jgi:hypothetical protein